MGEFQYSPLIHNGHRSQTACSSYRQPLAFSRECFVFCFRDKEDGAVGISSIKLLRFPIWDRLFTAPKDKESCHETACQRTQAVQMQMQHLQNVVWILIRDD